MKKKKGNLICKDCIGNNKRKRKFTEYNVMFLNNSLSTDQSWERERERERERLKGQEEKFFLEREREGKWDGMRGKSCGREMVYL